MFIQVKAIQYGNIKLLLTTDIKTAGELTVFCIKQLIRLL